VSDLEARIAAVDDSKWPKSHEQHAIHYAERFRHRLNSGQASINTDGTITLQGPYGEYIASGTIIERAAQIAQNKNTTETPPTHTTP
jgi:hypothetical protein